MKCIGKYSKLISVLLLTVVMATGCGITDLLGTKNVVAEYEAENYNKDLYTGKLFASDLCVASGDISLSGISSDETNTLHSAALFDVDRKKVDFSYQMFDKIYPASTTKIMTALVALENADLSDVVTVSQNADMNSFAADEATCGIKAGDKIADFLRLCNASNALFEFEDSRIQRDFYNQITRLDNCEVANEVKSLKAAKSQLEAIEFLESHAKNIVIPEKIMHAMQIRKMYPEANLNELCLECKNEFGEDISKSGMKHRLAKVKQMASELKEELDA